MKKLITEIKNCKACKSFLPHNPNPILAADKQSKIIIIGQAPGRIVHETMIAWNDKSGDNLRRWMGIDKEIFYNAKIVSLIPMGFCYPGKGANGDLPPRPECAPLWHARLLERMKNVKLILLVGQYAQDYYLKENSKQSLTETVKHFRNYLPQYFPLPHPSPRNNIWQAKKKWFVSDVLPSLQKEIKKIINE